MTNAAIIDLHAPPQQRPETRHPERGPDRHLQALPTPSVRRSPRLVHGILALAGLGGIVAAQLGFSVIITEGAYTLSALGAESSALARSEQTLSEDVAVLASPQNVAVAADELGMLAGQPSQFLTLSGVATAGGPDAMNMQVPALDQSGLYVPNALLSQQPQTAAVVQEVREEAIEPYPGMLLPVGEVASGTGASSETVAPTEPSQPAPGTLLPATAGE